MRKYCITGTPLVCIGSIIFIGSILWSGCFSDNNNYNHRTGKNFLEYQTKHYKIADNRQNLFNQPIPSTFGHTHFILGMDQEQVKKIQSKCQPTPVSYSEETQKSLKECLNNKAPCLNAFFSPDDGLENIIIDLINHEQSAITIAVFQFTNLDIARSLLRAHKRGVSIKIITDPSCLQDRFNKITWLNQSGIEISVYQPDVKKQTTLSIECTINF